MTQWQLAGNAAEFYERWPVPYILGPWVPILLDAAAVGSGDDVLDIACGTGVVARLAARSVAPNGKVTGLDLNAGMLAVARALPLPPGMAIDWREGSALALPFGAQTFESSSASRGCSSFLIDRSLSARCDACFARVGAPRGGDALLKVSQARRHVPGGTYGLTGCPSGPIMLLPDPNPPPTCLE